MDASADYPFWKARKLIRKSWDNEVVVFNLVSGNTHLLNPVAGRVLEALEMKSGSAPELAEQLASQVDCGTDEELIRHVEKLLADLDELGLIERVSQ